MARAQIPCSYEFSTGNGTGVAEAIGNWGFSNDKLANDGHELARLKCLFAKMEALRSPKKPLTCIRYDRRNDPEAWYVKPSPHECKPVWTFPEKRPLITYSSTADIIIVSDLNRIGSDLVHPIPGRSYMSQGVRNSDDNDRLVYEFPNEFDAFIRQTDKWYRMGPECCPQPSCLAPQCGGRC